MRQLLIGLLIGASGCTPNVEDTSTETAEDPFQEQVTIWTDEVELFYHHAPLVAGVEGQSWAVHVTDLATFTPVEDAVVRLRFLGPTGELETVVEAPDRPGLYTPEPVFPEGGGYDLSVWIERDGRSHEVYVGPIIVYASVADVPELEPEETVGISFLKEQQWAVPFATVAARTREIPRSIEAVGAVTPAAGRHAMVTAPVSGILRAEAARRGPLPGQWVRENAFLTVLSPTEDDAGFAELLARHQRLEREVARAERLYELEAIPQRRLEELRHDLDVTQASLEALGGSPENGYEYVLRSPIDGVVNERHVTAGARVAPGAPLFSIVDARQVWIRLDVSSLDAARALDATGATFTVEGSDRVYRTAALVSVGRAIDPEHRTLPVLFAMPNQDQQLKLGMLVRGRVLLGEPVSGLAIPSAAVRDEDGMLVAYVQIGGESFERRAITVGPTDGEWTIVASGVRPGERVVTVGAYQVKLSSLNTSAISDHGHPH